MRKVTCVTVAVLAILFHSCMDSAAGRKVARELVSVVADHSGMPEPQGPASPGGPAPAGAGLDGLEIPAPLSDRPEQLLGRMAYSVSYNRDLKIPNWVAWHLTAEKLTGDAKRPSRAFHEDMDVPEPRATDADYVRSGYDRGHMLPAGDNKYSDEAMYQSFLLTNICPQDHGLNAGDWEELENACRKWARKYGDVYIVCGPLLYNQEHRTIGKNKVVVPEAFFKVVLCLKGTPKAIGFIYKNQDGDRPMGDYVNTVDEVERITGIDFFPSLPDDVEDRIEATCDINDWLD